MEHQSDKYIKSHSCTETSSSEGNIKDRLDTKLGCIYLFKD